tara:strand:- start:11141 stop:12082 length:942 start_codon:yes stop_codon:yes gene_type:complete
MFDVIVPTYQPPISLLKKCLESIRKQSFQDYTVWICDGTPEDWRRYDAMQQVFEEYPEFNYEKQTGEGVSQARNQIIEKGSNPYIAFLDADDFWREDYLTNMYEQGISKTTNNTIQIWFSEIVEQVPEVHEGYLENIGKQGKLGIKIERERILQRYDVLNFIPLDYQIYFHANTALWFSATIFSRNILDKIPFREHLHTGEDTQLTLDCIVQGWRTQYLPFIGAHRHNHSAQATQRFTSNIDWIREQLESIEPKAADLTKELIEDKSEAITETQKHILLAYLFGGKKRGFSYEGGSQSIYLISEEELELEELR